MEWTDAEQRIRDQIVPGTGILKCDGAERRKVISNGSERITMRTGATTAQTKSVSYAMLKHAFEVIQTTGRFDAADFRSRFPKEYAAAPCRYSMTGGVLVEVGVAKREPGPSDRGCRYIAADALSNKPVQPTRAAKPNGLREPSRYGPRG